MVLSPSLASGGSDIGGPMDSDAEAAVGRLIDKDQIIDLVHHYSYFVDHRLYDEVSPRWWSRSTDNR
jgi:hypothetical protein